MIELNNATVTITGGTGSFGKTMVHDLLASGVAAINILSRDEAKQDDMRKALSDPRVKVAIRDVGAMIREAAGSFDAILLDVDNGPDGLTRPDNDGLYSDAGLRSARRALAPGGVLAVWSATPSQAFPPRLSRCGFDVVTHAIRAGRGKRGNRHTIWIAVKSG